MTDETTEEGKPERPKLKSLEDFKPEESTGKIFDFQKAKEEREEDDEEIMWPPKLRTKFCFQHGEQVFNFDVGPCGDGFHIGFISFKEMQTPFGTIVAQHPVLDKHVELNKFEKLLTKIGFKFDIEKRVELETLNMKKKIVKILDDRKKAEKIKNKFRL